MGTSADVKMKCGPHDSTLPERTGARPPPPASKYFNLPALRSRAIVIAEHAAHALPALDDPDATSDFFASFDQPISQSLVVAFLVIIQSVRRQCPSQHVLTEKMSRFRHSVSTQPVALKVRIQIG